MHLADFQLVDAYLNISDYMQCDIFYLYFCTGCYSTSQLQENITCGIDIKWKNLNYRHRRISLCRCLRPHHNEHTRSRLITEVKHCRAMIVLGWGTAWEHLVPQASLVLVPKGLRASNILISKDPKSQVLYIKDKQGKQGEQGELASLDEIMCLQTTKILVAYNCRSFFSKYVSPAPQPNSEIRKTSIELMPTLISVTICSLIFFICTSALDAIRPGNCRKT